MPNQALNVCLQGRPVRSTRLNTCLFRPLWASKARGQACATSVPPLGAHEALKPALRNMLPKALGAKACPNKNDCNRVGRPRRLDYRVFRPIRAPWQVLHVCRLKRLDRPKRARTSMNAGQFHVNTLGPNVNEHARAEKGPFSPTQRTRQKASTQKCVCTFSRPLEKVQALRIRVSMQMCHPP